MKLVRSDCLFSLITQFLLQAEYRFIVKEEPRNGDSVYRRYLTAVAQTTKFEIRAGASGMSP